MGQDKPPQYSTISTTAAHYVPKFSAEQTSFLQLAHRFASVKPLSLRIFLDLVQEADELFSRDFPQKKKEYMEEQVDTLAGNPVLKQLISAHLSKQDYSAALIAVTTLLFISLQETGSGEHQNESSGATNLQNQQPAHQPTQAIPDKASEFAEIPPSDEHVPKFSSEQQAFLDCANRFASVRPLSLKIFLNLVSEDEDLLAQEFPDVPKETIESDIDGMLISSTAKRILSAHLANRDYSAALISILTLLTVGRQQPGGSWQGSRIKTDSPEVKSLLDLVRRVASSSPIDTRGFLDLVVACEELLSKTFPKVSREAIVERINQLSSNSDFNGDLASRLQQGDFLIAFLFTITEASKSF